VETLEADGVGDPEYVGDEFGIEIGGDAIGPRSRAVPALVDGDHAVALGRGSRDQGFVHERGLREAVEKNQALAVAPEPRHASAELEAPGGDANQALTLGLYPGQGRCLLRVSTFPVERAER